MVTALLLALLDGCARSEEAPPAPPEIRRPAMPSSPGAAVFYATSLGGLPGCVSCHTIGTTRTRLAPSLQQIAAMAAHRVPGMGAEAYVRQSILEPSAFVVPGFPDVMPHGYGDVLTPAQLDAVVHFPLLEPHPEEEEDDG